MKFLKPMAIILLYCVFTITQVCAETYQADHIPWSGYWWPFRSGGLVTGRNYNGSPSPLSKLDFVTQGSYQGKAYYYGLRYFYRPDALSWEGMCYSWAVASILEKEPAMPGVFNGETFLVGDKKALLTAAYHRTLQASYLVNRPEDFHRILENFIKEEKSPIIIDLHTDGEVWNYPVFRYNTDYRQRGRFRHYSTTIYYPSNAIPPDYVGTLVETTTYQYYFEVDQEGNIIESDWEGQSIDNPPLKAYEPFSIAPDGNGVDYEQVKKIVAVTDDPYEENDSENTAAALSGGVYKLLGGDTDFFRVSLKKDDDLKVEISVPVGKDLRIAAYDPSGKLLQDEKAPAVLNVSGQTPGAYLFKIIPFEDFVPYELSLDHRLKNQMIFPVNSGGGWINGFALLSSTTDLGRTVVSLIDRGGIVRKGAEKDFALHKLSGILENEFSLSLGESGYIRVDSDVPFTGLLAAANSQGQLAGSDAIDVASCTEKVVFPYANATEGVSTNIGLINLGAQSESVMARSYNTDGNMIAEAVFEMMPGEKIEKRSWTFLAAGSKGVSFSTASGNPVLHGYLNVEPVSLNALGKTIVNLPPSGSPLLVVPHVASGRKWRTLLAVINEGEANTTINIIGYDADGQESGTVQRILNAKQSITAKVSDIFSGTAPVASIKVMSISGQPLRGYMIYISNTANQLAGIPIQTAPVTPIFLSHLAVSRLWWTGIGVMNAGDRTADFVFTLFDEVGNIVDEDMHSLKPNQRLATSLDVLFPEASAGKFMKIDAKDSQTALSGVYTIGSSDNMRMMGGMMK